MARGSEFGKGSKLIVLASVCIVVAALYFAQVVLIPLALALLFSFLLAPVVGWLERLRLGRAASTIIVVVLAMGLVGGLGYVVGRQLVAVVKEMPRYRNAVEGKLARFRRVGAAVKNAGDRLEDFGRVVSRRPSAPAPAGAPDATAPAQSQPPDGSQPPDHGGSGQTATATPPQPAATQPGTPGDPLYVRTVSAPASQVEAVAGWIGRFLDPVLTAGLVIVFVIFMLLNREDLRDRIIRLLGHGRLNLTTQALDEAAQRISRYLLAQALVNLCYGVAVAGGLWVIGHTLGRGGGGFPNVLLWGLLCTVLRFVPYVGIWIAAALPIVVSFALPGGGAFIGVVVMFALYEILVSQFIEPYTYGSSTGMSALAILVAAVFWTWLWGPIGLLLSTPLTVCLVVMGKYVPQLEFLDILLGDEPVLEPPVRLYQRLLALDDDEATELAREEARGKPLDVAFDAVLLPALALAERDRQHGRLDDRHYQFAHETMRQLVEELGDLARAARTKEAAARTVEAAREGTVALADAAVPDAVPAAEAERRATVPQGCTINVLLLPAKDEADEIAALMLAQVLELDGYCASPVSPTALASEMVDLVEQKKADVVVVSAMPPAAVAHSRYLCKRLHGRYAELRMLVGLWGAAGDPRRTKERLACDESVTLVTGMAEARKQIEQLAHPLLVQSSGATGATGPALAASPG